jgi:thiamine kinase-like enzyme
MNEAHRTSRGTVLAGFAEHRERCLLELLAAPARPDTWLTAELAREWIAHAADLPAVVYKDANVRNFLLTSTVVAVDFDTVTLAPLGYDLAKLVVSATMTYGPLDTDRVTSCLHKYNELLSETGLGTCTSEQFSAWAEMHHVLTSPYLGRNGYRFSGRIVM